MWQGTAAGATSWHSPGESRLPWASCHGFRAQHMLPTPRAMGSAHATCLLCRSRVHCIMRLSGRRTRVCDAAGAFLLPQRGLAQDLSKASETFRARNEGSESDDGGGGHGGGGDADEVHGAAVGWERLFWQGEFRHISQPLSQSACMFQRWFSRIGGGRWEMCCHARIVLTPPRQSLAS